MNVEIEKSKVITPSGLSSIKTGLLHEAPKVVVVGKGFNIMDPRPFELSGIECNRKLFHTIPDYLGLLPM